VNAYITKSNGINKKKIRQQFFLTFCFYSFFNYMPVTPEQYVDTIIETFTGRKMNPAFRNHLVEGLKSGQLTASMVDLAVINSKEGKEFAEKKKVLFFFLLS